MPAASKLSAMPGDPTHRPGSVSSALGLEAQLCQDRGCTQAWCVSEIPQRKRLQLCSFQEKAHTSRDKLQGEFFKAYHSSD